MTTSTSTAIVTICRCGHGERMHELDPTADHGRGFCGQRSCRCYEYRPGATADVTPPPTTAAASAPDIPPPPPRTPDPIPASATPAASDAGRKIFRCDPCDQTFASPQALGGHRRYKHGPAVNTRPDLRPDIALPEGAKQGPSADRTSAPAEVQTAPLTPTSGTPTPEEDPAVTEEEAPSAPPDTAATVRHSLRTRINLGLAGWVELDVVNAATDELLVFVDLIREYLAASTFTTIERTKS